MKSAVTDYLLGLTEKGLMDIAADFLGWERNEINYDLALQWCEGISDSEVDDVWDEMNANLQEEMAKRLEGKQMFRDMPPECDLCDNPIAVRNAVKRAGRFKGNKFDVCMTCWDCEGFDGSTKAELEEIEKDHQQYLKRRLRLTLQQALNIHECYPEFSKAKVSEVYLDGSLTTNEKCNKIQRLMHLFEPNTQNA